VIGQGASEVMYMDWRYHGNGTASEIFGDQLVFRNLRPIDSHLPGLAEFRTSLGIPEAETPRKLDPAYGKVVAEILKAAQERRNPGIPLQELIYIGDTRGSDGKAFRHILEAGDWQGALLIVNEEALEPDLVIDQSEKYFSGVGNHWKTVLSFERQCLEGGFMVGDRTAVILDLDKTTLGGRGRNDQVINQARVSAVESTVERTLEGDFNLAEFQRNYQVLNAQDYHAFTEDNQDCIAYICILLGSGLLDLESLLFDLRSSQLAAFKDFLRLVESRKGELSPGLREFHREFQDRFLSGDPTPFKAFRRREYLETIARMGPLQPDQSAAQFLEKMIAITGELYQLAETWKDRGVLLFGLSDKPDEASLPTPQQISDGFQPIHRMQTAVITGA